MADQTNREAADMDTVDGATATEVEDTAAVAAAMAEEGQDQDLETDTGLAPDRHADVNVLTLAPTADPTPGVLPPVAVAAPTAGGGPALLVTRPPTPQRRDVTPAPDQGHMMTTR